jgi:hypothetical protein
MARRRQPWAHGRRRTPFLLLVAATLLSACATPPASDTAPAPAPSATTATPALLANAGLTQVATQPLNDFNLLNSEIPAVLVAAQKAPYAEPAGHSCTLLLTELQALDAALGPDIDAAAAPATDPGLMEKATDVVGQYAVGTVKNTVSSVVDGVVPFRSWVRKLSGAERHSSAVAAAIGAGTLRRAYLKGWWQGSDCAGPARRP